MTDGVVVILIAVLTGGKTEDEKQRGDKTHYLIIPTRSVGFKGIGQAGTAGPIHPTLPVGRTCLSIRWYREGAEGKRFFITKCYIDPKTMSELVTEPRADTCHRCLQPVPAKASRCPNCGDPLKKGMNVRLVLAMLALLVFVVTAVTAFRMMQTEAAKPADQTVEQDPLKPAQDTPPPPEKKPALGQ